MSLPVTAAAHQPADSQSSDYTPQDTREIRPTVTDNELFVLFFYWRYLEVIFERLLQINQTTLNTYNTLDCLCLGSSEFSNNIISKTYANNTLWYLTSWSDLTLQYHDRVVEVVVLQGGRRPVEQSQGGACPAGETERWKLSVTSKMPVLRTPGRTLGRGHSLGLKCVVGASMVEIMTQAADHESQDLCIWQDILESGRLPGVE